MKKSQVSQLLRKLNLLYVADKMRFYVERFKHREKNAAFKKAHPNVVLPPDYLIYESFLMDYDNYYNGGLKSAKWLVDIFKNYTTLEDKKVLDWGCGPGRIIRHLPMLMGQNSSFYGTDYNSKTIDWDTKNLKGFHFNNNTLEASLPYEENTFDLIYGISIFTHLSEKAHYEWYTELYRVLKPGGVMFLTMQGDNYRKKLTEDELIAYNNGKIIIRGNVKEGHRTYSAFHPKGFVKNLFSNAEILDHLEFSSDTEEWVPQDMWVLKKR